MSITPRKNKAGKTRYRVQVSIKGVRSPAKTFGTKREAEIYKSNQILQAGGKAKNEISFDDLVYKFKLEHLSLIKPSTARRYILDLDTRIVPSFSGKNLSEISNEMILNFRFDLKENTALSDKSINNCTDTLRTMFNRAVEWEMIDATPFKIKKLKLEKREPEWWSDLGDIHKFKSSIQGHQYEAAFLLALDLGMRLSEVVGLSKQDIDWKAGKIKVHRQWSEHDSMYVPLKNSGFRTLSFDKDKQLEKSLLRACTMSNHIECIFVTSTGNRVLPRRLGNGVYHNARKKAGCPDLSFHGLRHTYASWYACKGGDLFQLKYNMGHADLQTTMRYAHHRPQDSSSQVSY